ncbi:hypothetical protein [Methanosphaera sp.]|jgi:hypothetical protein|uniref:hypothetical protein n=1 Tax=Methanosphaera sp. TaxID=2666342 RepID=UPI003D8A43A8
MVNKKLTNGKAHYEWDYLADGTYTANIEYKGDTHYFPSTNKTEFIIHDIHLENKTNPTIKLNLSSKRVNYGEHINFTVKLFDSLNKKISNNPIYIVVDGKETKYSTDNYGIATGIISLTTSGKHEIYAYYKESNKFYEAISDIITVYVYNVKTSISVSDTRSFIQNNAVLHVNVTTEDNVKINGNLVIELYKGEILKMTYKKTLTNGTAVISIPSSDLEVGIYSVKTSYTGTSIYASSSCISSLTIDDKVQSQLLISTVTQNVYVTDTNTITCKLLQNTGEILPNQQIILYIKQGENLVSKILTTNDEGIATTDFNYDSEGEYQIYAEFIGTEEYNATASSKLIINVTKIPVMINLTYSDNEIYLGQSIPFKVELQDVRNKLPHTEQNLKVNCGVNNFNCILVWNSESNLFNNLKYTVTPSNISDNSIIFTYKGSDIFQSISRTIPILVKAKEATTLTLTGFDNEVFISRPINYFIKLKGANSIPAGQVVTINFTVGSDTTSITKTTNANGEINDSYIFNKVGVYTINVSYEGNERYLDTTIVANETINQVGTTTSTIPSYNVYVGTSAEIPVNVTAIDNTIPEGEVELNLNKQ